jgi:hypothetical protein
VKTLFSIRACKRLVPLSSSAYRRSGTKHLFYSVAELVVLIGRDGDGPGGTGGRDERSPGMATAPPVFNTSLAVCGEECGEVRWQVFDPDPYRVDDVGYR